MGSEDEQVKAVFTAALERPAEGRSAWLDRVCRGNPGLRARVETLLDAHERAAGFMEDDRSASPAAGAPAADVPAAESLPAVPEEQPGALIGHYKLLQKIGEGGFGSVYMAEQTEPVVRRVALKVIKLGMDTKQVVARFEAERQALAMMDHPNIARVLDAGATASGRPYFVMELVRGVPITEYCDTANLPTAQRLELFAQVCGALQHAHLKGVIHRDVKPGNVLVTLHDGVPVPKVIDFGIAKATDRRLTEKTLFTELRQVIGTPEYMSPEQAENSGLDIDTRSDVYSLGVLLYELLTATTPFDAAALREKGYGEMLRVIREDDPPAPSTRIATLGDRLAVAARLHGIAPELWSRRLRGDLDWIVMKCLEKDRTRRYETASALAADVRRHLGDEPVSAGPPGAGYRVRKFVRRHRAQVAAAGVVLAVLVLGVVGTTTGMMRALREKRRADEEAARATSSARAEVIAKVAAQENEQKAVGETKRAEAAKEEEAAARRRAETISGFVTTALRSSDPENAGGGQGTTILAAMDNAVADIGSGRFEDDPATRARLQVTIGSILRNNGRLADAEALLSQALETQRRLHGSDSPEAAYVMNELAVAIHQLGRREEARKLYEQVLSIYRRLHPGDHATVSMALNNLANTLPPAEAEPLFREALAMDRRLFGGSTDEVWTDLGNLAGALQAQGRTAEAEPLFAETLEMVQRIHPGDHPYVAKALDNLGKARFHLGRRDDALDLLTRALAMRRRLFKGPHPDFATGLANLAQLHLEGGRLADAERLYAESVAMRRRIFEGDHDDVANGLSTLADVLLEAERPAEAEAHSAQSLEMRRRLHPGDDMGVVVGLTQLATAQAAQGRSAEAGPLLVQAREMLRRLSPGDSPGTAIAFDNLGKAFQRAGRLDDAETLLAQALQMRERIYEGDHADLAKGLNNLALAIAARGRFSEALAMQRRSLEMYQRLFGIDDPQFASAMGTFAVTLRDAGRPAEAEPYAVKAVEMHRRRVQGDDAKLAMACFNLGTIREALGRWPECVQPFEEASAMIRRLLPAADPNVLHSMTRLATTYYFVGAADKAIPLFEEAMKGEIATFGREHPDTVMTIGNLGANYATVRRWAEAVPLLEEARRHAKRYPQLGFVHLQLLDAYVHLADSGAEGCAAKAGALADEIVAECRATSPQGSPQLAQGLVMVGLSLVGMKSWDAAEPLLREALAIREELQPDAWTTLNTRSLLGAALLGQGRYAEAEPLLLSGYRGLKEREATLDANGRSRIPPALDRLVQFYEATGNATEAAVWRKELESRRAADGAGR